MKKIIELALIRNDLANKSCTETTMIQIEEIKNKLQKINYKKNKFMLEIIKLAELEIAKKEYINASHDFALIHNFSSYEEKLWNEKYFYKFDFVDYYDYLMENNNLFKLKKIIFLISKYLIEETIH